jgi:hypothetical protein
MSDKLDYFLKTNKIPNIMIHGDSGSGKKTIVKQFIDKIYKNNKNKEKYILNINCGDGMGIKLIREDLKFFGKTVVEKNMIKLIVLYNGDKLTPDAQCALRRCIEIYSKNTRFIIIINNKELLLKPLLSRFCEIYIPSTHNYYKEDNNKFTLVKTQDIETIIKSDNHLLLISESLYDNGFHIFDIINYYKTSDDGNKNFYLSYIDVFRRNVLHEKIIIYFSIYLFKMRPSIELFNINCY